MSRKSTWQVEKINVNFNQKQWRQDLGEFIKSKKFWDGTTRVTRSKSVSKDSAGCKRFSVYNAYGGEVVIQYQNLYEILYSNELDLVKSYLDKRHIEKF